MISGIITAVLLGLFVIGTLWAYSPKRKRDFDVAAALPLQDDAQTVQTAQTSAQTAEETPR
jgi:cytochrome c oxidase cbb3-type subunit IV